MDLEDSNLSQMEDVPMSKRAKMEGPDSDRLLNFATAADEFELSLKRHKMPRDPMSHRIIEKRRRDRMNNCLADLSRLIPSSYHKQGQGRIEKTEIIEMAIKHINMLQQQVDKLNKSTPETEKTPVQTAPVTPRDCCAEKFYMGFKEAQDEVMRFLVEVESVSVIDPFCKKIMKHLENASKKFVVERDSEINECVGPEIDGNNQSSLFQHSSFYPLSSSGPSSVGDVCSKDDKHHDKQLRSLLGDQQSSIGGSYSYGSNIETSSSGMVPMFSYSLTNMGTVTDSSVVGSSGYVSDLSNIEKSSRDNVYKFKHNITKRFSQEGHHHHHHNSHHNQPSDTSSNTSSRDFEDDQGQFKWKVKHKGRSYHEESEGPGGSSTSNLDDSPSASHSSEVPRRKSMSKSNNSQISEPLQSSSSSSNVALPGFILHPTGTHYMPISVHNTNVAELFDSNTEHEGMPVFHPISIPVHFRRPVISMPNVTICTHISSQQRERNTKD